MDDSSNFHCIDHLVYAVRNLEKAIVQFEQLLGVRPVYGGRHLQQGTKNALVRLGKGVYLELLAPDAENVHIEKPRWMGVDQLTNPKITRWATKAVLKEPYVEALAMYQPALAQVVKGERVTASGNQLSWKLTLPMPTPEVEVVPFLIDWEGTPVHPADALPDMGCRLHSWQVYSPTPNTIQPVFDALHLPFIVKKADDTVLKLTIECPNGLVYL